MYKALAAKYGWDANRVASMTLYQQLAYLEDEDPDDPVVEFATMEEYQEWRANMMA